MSDSRVWGDLSKRRFMAWHLRIILNYWFQKIKSGGLGKTCVLLNGGEMELVRGRYHPPDTPPNKAATSECCGSHGKQNTEEFHSNRNLRRRNKLIPQKHQLAPTPHQQKQTQSHDRLVRFFKTVVRCLRTGIKWMRWGWHGTITSGRSGSGETKACGEHVNKVLLVGEEVSPKLWWGRPTSREEHNLRPVKRAGVDRGCSLTKIPLWRHKILLLRRIEFELEQWNIEVSQKCYKVTPKITLLRLIKFVLKRLGCAKRCRKYCIMQ